MRQARYRPTALSCLLAVFLSVAGASCSNYDSSGTKIKRTATESLTGFNPEMQGGFTGNSSNDSLVAPTAPVLNMRAAPGQLEFSWPAPPPLSTSKIIQANLVTREYTPVFSTSGNLVTEFTLPLAMHRADWQNTRFLLETCDADDCLFSDGKHINHLAHDLVTAISRESVAAGDRHSQTIVLSADGKTLVSAAAGHVLVQFRVGNQWWDSTTLHGNSFAEDAEFGHSIAISGNGNTVVVGAPGEKGPSGTQESGAVYIYERLGEGWANSARLGASDGLLMRFGAKVVMSEDAELLVVGVPDASVNGYKEAGKALVYQRISSQWRLSQTLQAAQPVAMARFADTLSLASDAALLFIGGNSRQGQVHEFEMHNGQFNTVSTLANTLADTTQFAEQLASSKTGNTLAVTRRGTLAENLTSVEILLYQRTNDGPWQLLQTMTPPDVLSSDSTVTLALSGDASTLSIGVSNPGSSGNNVTTYTSDRPWVAGGFAWARSSTLYSPATGDDEFAHDVALSDNGVTLVVAAPGAAREGLLQSGVAYAW